MSVCAFLHNYVGVVYCAYVGYGYVSVCALYVSECGYVRYSNVMYSHTRAVTHMHTCFLLFQLFGSGLLQQRQIY